MITANVGDIEVVLCRRGEAVLLTRKFVTIDDRTECQRVCKLDGFITAASSEHIVLKKSCIYCTERKCDSCHILSSSSQYN